mmetsp:Transcript_44735/g.140275  ORF Transcript_44735/g.140275 Transcript_44735/m.140275 type:complete len:242 (+) Transcript_44735:197-922(+)
MEGELLCLLVREPAEGGEEPVPRDAAAALELDGVAALLLDLLQPERLAHVVKRELFDVPLHVGLVGEHEQRHAALGHAGVVQDGEELLARDGDALRVGHVHDEDDARRVVRVIRPHLAVAPLAAGVPHLPALRRCRERHRLDTHGRHREDLRQQQSSVRVRDVRQVRQDRRLPRVVQPNHQRRRFPLPQARAHLAAPPCPWVLLPPRPAWSLYVSSSSFGWVGLARVCGLAVGGHDHDRMQ